MADMAAGNHPATATTPSAGPPPGSPAETAAASPACPPDPPARYPDGRLPNGIRRSWWKAAVWIRLREVEESVEQAIVAQGWRLGRSGGDRSIDASADQRPNAAATAAAAQAIVTTFREFVWAADDCLTAKTTRRSQLWDLITGDVLMTAFTSLHAAERHRILLLSGDQLMALLPSIRARSNAYLRESDPSRIALDGIPELTSPGHQALAGMQRQILSTVTLAANGQGRAGPSAVDAPAADAQVTQLTGMLGAHQQIAAEAFGAACAAEDMQQTQVRRFRGVLLGTFASLLVPVAALCVTAFMHPALLPMCLHTASAAKSICASGSIAPGSADLPLVLGLGAIGAALAVAKTLAGLNPSGVRYSLSVAQGLLKVALGAITAMLGILLLKTQNLPGVLATQAGLLMAAVVFGYAQQLFTGFIDQRAASLMRAASPTTPPAGSSAASGGVG